MQASCVRGILPARELVPVGMPNPILIHTFSQWMSGFATLQGREFPVIDLRAKLHLRHSTQGRTPYIVAVEIQTSDGPRLVGFVADRVCDIVQARERDFHLGKLRQAGRPRQVIDPNTLLEAEFSL
jgi:chemotaxis signal transduction protein